MDNETNEYIIKPTTFDDFSISKELKKIHSILDREDFFYYSRSKGVIPPLNNTGRLINYLSKHNLLNSYLTMIPQQYADTISNMVNQQINNLFLVFKSHTMFEYFYDIFQDYFEELKSQFELEEFGFDNFIEDIELIPFNVIIQGKFIDSKFNINNIQDDCCMIYRAYFEMVASVQVNQKELNRMKLKQDMNFFHKLTYPHYTNRVERFKDENPTFMNYENFVR